MEKEYNCENCGCECEDCNCLENECEECGCNLTNEE